MMKPISSAIFLALFAAGCAPVSPSTLKTPGGVAGDDVTGSFAVRSSSDVKGADTFGKDKDRIKKQYQIVELSQDQENALLESKELSIKLGVKSGRDSSPVDVKVIIHLGVETDTIRKEITDKFKMDVVRGTGAEDDVFTISVPKSAEAEDAWAYIKKNEPSISIAFREMGR